MAHVKIVTHNGAFHADDVCAVAVLDLVFKGNIEVVRTREPQVIEEAHIVLDVGGKNDGEKFFDHHQEGGAGARPNGIPYASFGLIWKRFGQELCSSVVAEKFDRIVVQAVDAADNGTPVVDSKFNDIFPLSFNGIVMTMNPQWNEDNSLRDTYFMEAVTMFKKVIEREILFLNAEEAAKEHVMEDYTKASDKRIIVLENNYPFQEVLSSLPEPLFAIYKSPQLESWHVKTVNMPGEVFKSKKPFPSTWAGKMNSELASITGVKDALFCHNKLFLATAKSKEGALALALLALA